MRFLNQYGFLLAGTALALGCQGSSSGGTSGGIGPAGGTVSMTDGVSIEVPAGALAEEVSIKVSASTVKRPGMLGATAYQFEPEGLKFLKPVKVTLPFTRTANLPDNVEEPVHVFRAPKGSTEFQDLGGTTVTKGRVQAETLGFSVFIAGTVTPTPIANGQKYPQGIAVNATHVYWANYGQTGMMLSGNNSRIMRAEIGGLASNTIGKPEIFADMQQDAKQLVIDPSNTYLYWVNGGSGPGKNDAGVMRMALAGGTPTRLIPATYPIAIAIDATYVYWLDADPQTVNRAKLDGTEPTQLAPSGPKPAGLALSATKIYWVNRGTSGMTDGKVMSAPIMAVMAPTALASGQAEPTAVAVDSSAVYWLTRGDGKVQRASLDGASPVTLQTLKRPTAIALDAEKYYVTDSLLGRVIAFSKATNAGVVRSSADGIPSRILQNASNLFWVNEGVTEYLGEINVIGKL